VPSGAAGVHELQATADASAGGNVNCGILPQLVQRRLGTALKYSLNL
jgi:hypothetical protein